jgi:hypothetical protein
MTRWFGFIFVIIIGVAIGLLYGWVINPVEYQDTTPDTLRIDYKTDYVLMVAETFHAVGDLELAKARLSLLGDLPPEEMVMQTILFAEKAGYTDTDLTLMRAFLEVLQTSRSSLEASSS